MKRILLLCLSALMLLSMSAKDIKKVVCIGNSITKGSWLCHPERDSYPAALNRILGDGYQVENLGVGGACASSQANLFYMKNKQYAAIKEAQPQIVTILLGHDDARKPNQKYLSAFTDGLRQMVQDLKALPSHPAIYLVTPTQVFSTAWDNDEAALKSQVVPAIQKVGAEMGVSVIDVYAATQGDSKYYLDGIHPDALGAGHVAEVIATGITGKKAKYVRPLSVPTIFTNHAVLQQKSEAAIWGYAAAGSKVTLKPSWGKAVTVTADTEGKWETSIPTIEASFTPYELEISQGKQKITLSDLLMGEVWLAAGQSNMQMELGGFYRTAVKDGPQAIADSYNEGLRLYFVPRSDCARPYDDVKTSGWQVACPKSVQHFSATGYFFARQLQKSLGIPVGIIQAAYGGASIVAFMSPEATAKCKTITGEGITRDFKDFKAPRYDEKYAWPQHTPNCIYNAMIAPIQGYTMKGAIWYQGCDDRRHPQLYKQLYHTFLDDWRAKWNSGDFPMYYAQIAPFGYKDNTAARMREAQEQIEDDGYKTWMICLMDNGWENNIHPSDKPTVGFRFAQRVLDKTYQMEGVNSTYPHYKSMEVREKDGKVVLRFTGADDGIAKSQQEITGFQIAGSDKIFYNVKAVDEGNTIVLTPPAGVKPAAVRYCFKDFCVGSVYNMRGNPLSSFRTDDWDN